MRCLEPIQSWMTTGKVQRFGSSVCKEKIGGIWWFGILLFNIMHQAIDGRLQCWTKWMVGVSRNII